jgi:hypothetical protein
MIEMNPDAGIYLTNWAKYQNVVSLDDIKEKNRLRKAKSREKQKLLKELPPVTSKLDSVSQNSHVTERDMSREVTQQNRIEKNREDKEVEENKNREDKGVQGVSLSAKKFADDSTQIKLSIKLKKLILQNNPNARVPQNGQIQSWAMVIDKMLRLDHRPPQEIEDIIEFSQKHSFWQTNILSTASLRDAYDKLFLLRKQELEKKNGFGQASSDLPIKGLTVIK